MLMRADMITGTVRRKTWYSTDIMASKRSKKADIGTATRLDATNVRNIVACVSDWFSTHQRNLIFRNTRDPYAIMVSEFMLQQTTVAAVQPYYTRFLNRFPTVQDLAAANDGEVLSHWAGLGYYRRARNLQAAAKKLVENWDGEFPQSATELQSLPGVGRYTAGAIASAAFDLPAPILEANTVRVYSRLGGEVGVIGNSAFSARLWEIADELVRSADSPRIFNMGAMELGALICKPQPLCDQCPVSDYCVAFRSGTQELTPIPKPKPVKIDVDYTCLVLEHRGQFLFRRTAAGQWHEGMWEFPSRRNSIEDIPPGKVFADLLLQCSLPPSQLDLYTRLNYTITHHRVNCHVYVGKLNAIPDKIELEDGNPVFMPLEQISDYAMSSAQRKLLRMLLDYQSKEGERC